jgi:hypothetical protein
MADPCANTAITQMTYPYLQNINLKNFVTSVKGSPDSQIFGVFIDTVSVLDPSNPKCGDRTYTLGGDYTPTSTWLQLDTSTGTLTASTTFDSDVNYSGNSGKGYKVTMKVCLNNYPLACSPT